MSPSRRNERWIIEYSYSGILYTINGEFNIAKTIMVSEMLRQKNEKHFKV